MVSAILLNSLGIISVFTPVALLFLIGPESSKRRLIYGVTGLGIASLIGGILFVFSVDTRFAWSSAFQGRLARDVTAAIVEELIRYPGILIAQYLGIKYLQTSQNDDDLTHVESKLVDNEFTSIIDPHGMGAFFGVGYGMGETLAFYVYPTVQEILSGNATFLVAEEVTRILLRITAVMAHVGLTYLAMAITSQKGYWRITLILHLSANVSNRLFTDFAANVYANIVFAIFTRFAIVLIAYFMLRPRIRYLSPAVLLFLLVLLFLITILISTFIALLIGLIGANIFRPI